MVSGVSEALLFTRLQACSRAAPIRSKTTKIGMSLTSGSETWKTGRVVLTIMGYRRNRTRVKPPSKGWKVYHIDGGWCSERDGKSTGEVSIGDGGIDSRVSTHCSGVDSRSSYLGGRIGELAREGRAYLPFQKQKTMMRPLATLVQMTKHLHRYRIHRVSWIVHLAFFSTFT